MNKQQEQKFFQLAVVIFVIILAIVYVPSFFSQSRQNDNSKISQQPSPSPSPAVLDTTITIAEGENMGQQLEFSDALLMEDLVVGKGATVKEGDVVKIHYHGTLTDGTVFDSSVERGEPFVAQIGVGQLISGWDQGVPGMKVGGKRKLIIAPELAYGNQAIGKIPAGSTLIFEVEVLDIVK